MSLSFRFFVIAFMLSFTAWFLYPSLYYWFNTDKETRELLNSGIQELDTENYSSEQIKAFEQAKKYKEIAVSMGLDIKGGIFVVLEADFSDIREKMDSELTPEKKKEALSQVQRKIVDRIDEFGVSDLSIRRVGDNRLVVQIPGLSSFDRIKDVIEKQGVLQFQLVDEETTQLLDWDSENKVLRNPEVIPAGSILSYRKEKKSQTKRIEIVGPIALFEKVELSGEHLTSASKDFGEMGGLVVRFDLDREGSFIFSDLTGKNRGKRLAIVLDGDVLSAPTIESRISGSGVINGNYTHEEAADLALVLKTGSLPTKISIITKNIVGPTMGWDLLNKSFNALFIGLILVVIFMIIWYRFAGLVASLALALNGIMIFSILAAAKFTITLPGIAGLILTMGMAIDANVIIFERIREEVRVAGTDFVDAIRSGYDKAFWSIWDANITTLIAAFILSQFGTGQIKGFAFSLFVGILVSMFTALFCTRFIFEWLIERDWIKDRKIMII